MGEYQFKCKKCSCAEYDIIEEEDGEGNDILILKCSDCEVWATEEQNQEFFEFCDSERTKKYMKKYPSYIIFSSPIDYVCDGAKNISDAPKIEEARVTNLKMAELIVAAIQREDSDRIITIMPEWELMIAEE